MTSGLGEHECKHHSQKYKMMTRFIGSALKHDSKVKNDVIIHPAARDSPQEVDCNE